MNNVDPTAYPVQQMSQQLLYGYSTPNSRPPLQIQPQQPPVHNQYFPASFPPNNKQHEAHYQQQQQQHQHQHQQHQEYQQHQAQSLQQEQQFPPQQAYQQFQQSPQPFYGNPGNPPLSGNGVIATSAQNVSPQVYAPPSNSQAVNTTSHSAPPFKPSEASPSVTSSQQSQSMAAPAALLTSNNPFSQRSSPQNGGIAQRSQLLSPAQTQPPTQAQSSALQPQSPQSIAQEKARVSVLLEINSYLLQEVVSLQAQGKAGGPPTSLTQQSPSQETAAGSPASVTDPSNPLNNSPIDPTKPAGAKPPSQEYIECMRRLQANLAYLAAIADAKKKAAGSIPAMPAIMAPPPHLADVKELYKKLNGLFAGAGQLVSSKVMSAAGPQSQNTG